MHTYKADTAQWLLLNPNQLLDSEKAPSSPPHTHTHTHPLVTSPVKSGLDLVVFFWSLEPLNSHKPIQLFKGMAKSHLAPIVSEREVREKSTLGTRSLDPPLLPVMVSPLLRKLHSARGRALIQERLVEQLVLCNFPCPSSRRSRGQGWPFCRPVPFR